MNNDLVITTILQFEVVFNVPSRHALRRIPCKISLDKHGTIAQQDAVLEQGLIVEQHTTRVACPSCLDHLQALQ